MIYLTAAFIAISVVFFILSRDVRHPAVLYNCVWALTMFLLNLNIISYIKFSAEMSVFIFTSALNFSLSAIFGGVSQNDKPKNKNLYASRPRLISHMPSAEWLAGLTIFGVAGSLYYYQSKFTLRVLLTNPSYVRYSDVDGSGLFGILLLLPSVAVLALIVRWLLVRTHPWLTFITILIAFAYFAILPERSTMVGTVLWVLGILVVQDSSFKQNLRRYLNILLASVIVFLVFFTAVSARTGKVNFIKTYRYAVSAKFVPDSVIDPYIYITGSLPSLDTLVTDSRLSDFNINFGHVTYPIARVIQIISPPYNGSRLTEREDPAYIPFYFNTFTWLSFPLRDLGLIGSQLYVAIVGLLSGLIFRLARETRSPFWIYLYGGLFAAIVLSGMTNRFSSLYWWVAAVFSYLTLYNYKRIYIKPRVVKAKSI